MTAFEERGGNSTFDLHLKRRPFFLYPGGQHPIKRWGERLDALYPGGRGSIQRLGSSAGYKFDFEAPLSDTMDSHRLYLWAERQGSGQGERVAEAISRMYFENARPLADREMLCSCVSEVGLDVDSARSYLASEAGYDEVRESVENNLRMGIHSIPVFVFRSLGYETVVHGSASVRRFGEVLDTILATEVPERGETSRKSEL